MTLTPRESEVLALLAKGMLEREVAAALDISPLTVKAYVQYIGNKLGTTNRVILALIYHGIEQPRAPREQYAKEMKKRKAYDKKRPPRPQARARAARNVALELTNLMNGWAR